MAIDTNVTPAGEKVVASFANRFQVAMGPQVTRIAFGEAVAGLEANFHTAIVMLTSDVKELSELITHLIAKNQQQAGV